MKISIIIATYNASKTLARCLSSIASQKVDDIEVIVVDGASTDNTLEIVNSFSSINIVCISEPDKGIYDAWNKGIKMSTGDWIMFLGADDYLIDSSMNCYFNFLRDGDHSKTDLICGKFVQVDQSGKCNNILGEPYVFNQFVKYMNISHGSSLHNKKLFEELGLFSLDYRICSDYEFLLRKPLNSEFIDRPLICMQVGGVSGGYDALYETFLIRKDKRYISTFENCYYYLRGWIGLSLKKLFCNL